MRPDAPAQRAQSLQVTEIFYSLQGESRTAGFPTAFVRLTGCPLRCRYCDTRYAFHGGEPMTIGAVLSAVARYATRYVTVTGGEPLAQAACPALLGALCDAGYEVSLETSGALDVAPVDARVVKVMDVKTPGSGEAEKNRWENLAHLGARDQIKFVICDRADYEWARAALGRLPAHCELLFMPAYGGLEAARLAEWILADGLKVRLQIQLHKLLWGERRGR